MKIKLFGMMMAIMCLAMMGGASATKLTENYMVNDITINVTNPSADFRCEPVYNKNYVKLLGYSTYQNTDGSVVLTYFFKGKVGERIIMNQYEPGIDVPIATSVYFIPSL